MSELSDYVWAEVRKAEQESLANIQNERRSAELYLNTKQEQLEYFDQRLFNEIEGFRIGAIPPKYKTDNANVEIRDSDLKRTYTDIVYKDKPTSIFAIVGFAAIAYYIWKGK